MHLRLNDSEMQTLVEMVCLAVQAASWNQADGSQPDFERYLEMEQRILERASQAGLQDLIAYDAENQRLVLDDSFRESSYPQQCVDELRNSVFWEEMMYRFAERDLMEKLGETAWLEFPEEKRRALAKPLEARYWSEFQRNGIDNFHLVHPPEEG